MRQASGYGGVFKFLASDRVSALLVELASHGVVDFKHANVLDRKWNLRLKWLAQSYSSNKSAEVVKLAILRYTGALATVPLIYSIKHGKVWISYSTAMTKPQGLG